MECGKSHRYKTRTNKDGNDVSKIEHQIRAWILIM